jgi:hypothetical protein
VNIGEAITYGLLGGTAAAADHYVSDWREKTRMAREQAFQKEGWKNQAEQAKVEREFRSSEAGKERAYRTGEREAGQLYSSGEADKNRTFQRTEADTNRQFQAGQANANVSRGLQLAQGQADIKEQYRDKGMLFTFDKDGKMIPVRPNAEGFSAPVAQQLNGQFSYFGVGKDGKGLLKGKGSGSGKSAGGYETLKTPGAGGITQERTLYQDPSGNEFTYATDPQTNLPIKIPIQSGQQAPTTPEAMAQAEQQSEEIVNDLAEWFSTDATNFEPWGGSRAAAKEYFRQGALNGTLFNEQGQLMMPGQSSNTPTTSDSGTPSKSAQGAEDAQAASVNLYQSLSPDKQQQVQLFISGINQGRDRDLMIQRMIELGFTEQDLRVLLPAI